MSPLGPFGPNIDCERAAAPASATRPETPERRTPGTPNPAPGHSFQSDGVDLHVDTHRKIGRLDRRPGGGHALKVASVDPVHGGEVA